MKTASEAIPTYVNTRFDSFLGKPEQTISENMRTPFARLRLRHFYSLM